MPAFNERVTTTTQDVIAPYLVDTVLRGNVLAKKVLGATKLWRGETKKYPVKFAKNTTGGSFFGFDTLPTNATNNRVNLSYNPKAYQISVALPLTELTVNEGDEKVLDLIQLELTSAGQDMADDLGTIFYANGTSNSSKDFLGLGAIIDNGDTVATIGSLSRATYSTLQSTVTASGGTITLAKISTLLSAITDGDVMPTVGLCDQTVWDLIETLFAPEERIIKSVDVMKNGVIQGGGATAIYYRGIPILADRKATSQTLFFLNEDFANFYGRPMARTEAIKFRHQDIKGNVYSNVEGLGFSWSNWLMSENNAAIVAHIYLFGEYTDENSRRHGKLTGITGT